MINAILFRQGPNIVVFLCSPVLKKLSRQPHKKQQKGYLALFLPMKIEFNTPANLKRNVFQARIHIQVHRLRRDQTID